MAEEFASDAVKAPIGAPCWLDLLTSDVAKSNAFYTGMFGWTAGEGNNDYGGYFMYFLGGAAIAGGMPNNAGGVADRWGIHLKTLDAAAASDAAANAGGTAKTPVYEIGDRLLRIRFRSRNRNRQQRPRVQIHDARPVDR